MFTRKIVMQKTKEVGLYTLLSRCFGILREVLIVRFIGANALGDAFFTAWKVPNSMRKIFAEGALSAAFVPAIVQKVRKDGRTSINGLMSIGFLVFEGIVLLLCAVLMIKAAPFIKLIAPGFSPDQVAAGALYLRILMPFIFLISTSALLVGPLQSVGHFFMPAFGPVLLNIVYITGLVLCLIYKLSIETLCWFIISGGVLQLIGHLVVYIRLHFNFGAISKEDLSQFFWIFLYFIPCLLSMSVMEVGLFIDTSFASLLPKGTVSLINYANRFMGIPLGVFAVAFSTTLLPHFSRVSSYAPKRLGFYLFEATKLVWWVIAPFTGMFRYFLFYGSPFLNALCSLTIS
jgi:putative peptidoglycan lipid II flippase